MKNTITSSKTKAELIKELNSLRLKNSYRSLKETHLIKQVKKEIARLSSIK